MTITFMRSFPSQYEVKRLLSDLVPDGDQIKIARCMGVSAGEVSRRFNPNDERKVSIGEALRELCGICDTNRDVGLAFKAYINGYLDAWLAPTRATGELGLSEMACDIDKEVGEMLRARMTGKPVAVQRKETLEVIAAAEKYLAELEPGLREAGR